jgi:hypothetical protein
VIARERICTAKAEISSGMDEKRSKIVSPGREDHAAPQEIFTRRGSPTSF